MNEGENYFFAPVGSAAGWLLASSSSGVHGHTVLFECGPLGAVSTVLRPVFTATAGESKPAELPGRGIRCSNAFDQVETGAQ